MLAMTVAVGLLMQAPQDMKPWVDQGFDPVNPGAKVVSGAPELQPAQAWDGVVAQLQAQQIESKERAAASIVQRRASGWMPESLLDPVVARWARSTLREVEPQVLDQELLVRNHGFGQSYQAFLLVDPVEGLNKHEIRQLELQIDKAEHRLLVRGGCTVALWSLIALACFWLDRLTRGYMTGRLRLLGGVLGLCAPGIFLLP